VRADEPGASGHDGAHGRIVLAAGDAPESERYSPGRVGHNVRMVRSRLPALLALAAVGALVAVLVTVLVSGGSNATGAAPVQAATTEDTAARWCGAAARRGRAGPSRSRTPERDGERVLPRLSADSFVVLDAG
jgi:hypothetical protein